MPRYKIKNYQASWDFDNHIGLVRLQAENGKWSPTKRINNPSEFSAILDLLRNENPIFHITESDRVETIEEEIGDNE